MSGGYSDARIREMIAGRKAPKAYEVPGLDGVRVAIQLLSDEDIDNCRIEAQRYCARQKVDVDIDPDFLERETRRQIIWRSMREVDHPERPFFASDREVREVDAELLAMMFALYFEHQAWVSPMRALNREQVQELAEVLGKAPRDTAPAILAGYDSSTLRDLCISLASALRES